MPPARDDSDRFADLDRGSGEFQAAYSDFDKNYKRLHHDHNAAERVLPSFRYNTVFTMLQGLIFDIDPTSATPIALQIRLELSDDQIRPLLEARRPPASASVNRLSLRDRPHVRNEKLRTEIEKARGTWAHKLVAHGFVDVDIHFTVSQYQAEPLKSIKEELAGLGAKCYHFSQFQQETTSMTLSVVVKQFVLDHVLPPARRVELGVTITTNTAPAWSTIHMPLDAEPELEQSMVLAPPAADEQSPYDLPDPAKKPPTFGLRPAPIVKRDPCEQLIQEIMGRQRSNTLKKVRFVPKTKKSWHIFSSAARAEQQQPAWTQETRPFRGDPGIWGDDQWWMDDHARREALINGWKAATWCEELGTWPTKMHRDLSYTGSDPAVAVADKDFVLLPGLSPTYTTDRNHKWYEDNVEAADRDEAQREFVAAEQMLEVTARQARAFWRRFVQVQINAKLNPWQQPTSFEIAQMNRAQLEMANMLMQKENQLAKKADACEIRLSRSRFDVMGRLRMKALREIEAAPYGGRQSQPLERVRATGPQQAPAFAPGQVMPDTPVPRHLAPAMMRQNQAPAIRRALPPAARRQVRMPVMKARPVAEMPNTRFASQRAVAAAIPAPSRPRHPSNALDSIDTTPWPAYVDPMVELNDLLANATDDVARSMAECVTQDMPQSLAGSGLSTLVDSVPNSLTGLASGMSDGDLDTIPDVDPESNLPSLPNSISNDIPCTFSSSISDSDLDTISDSVPASLPNIISNDIPCTLSSSPPVSIKENMPPSLSNSILKEASATTSASMPKDISSTGPPSLLDSAMDKNTSSNSRSVLDSKSPHHRNDISNQAPSSTPVKSPINIPRSILQKASNSVLCLPQPSPATQALTNILMHANDLKLLRSKNSAGRIDSARGSQSPRVKFAVTERVYHNTMMSGGLGDAESDDETVVDHDEAEDSQDADEADGFVNDVAKVGIEAF